jgi:hypothetical protein
MCLAAMDIDRPLNVLISSEKWLNLKLESSGVKTRINTASMSDLSQLQSAVKERFHKSLADIDLPLVQLFDEKNRLIDDLDDIPLNYHEKNGPSLLIRIASTGNLDLIN